MRVLIVDDHPLFRAGLKALLFELDPAIDAVEAPSLKDVLEATTRGEAYDLVLLDLNLPDAAGLNGLRQVKRVLEASLVVVMSGEDDPRLIRNAIDEGACGYIPKTTDAAITVDALKKVLERGIYLPPNVLRDRYDMGGCGGRQNARPRLSERQLQVLQCLLQGRNNKIIGRELGIAEGTVKAHLAAVYQALGVATRTQAMYRAYELGFFDQLPDPPGT